MATLIQPDSNGVHGSRDPGNFPPDGLGNLGVGHIHHRQHFRGSQLTHPRRLRI
jgi:hypothetical protein